MTTVYRGQVFHGYLKPLPGCDDQPIRWKYKGMWPAFRAKYLNDLSKCATEDEQEVIILATMAAMIVSWNLTYPADHPDENKRGKPVPIDADVIKSDVMVHVRNRIMAVSTWQAYGDTDPELSVAQQVKAIADRAGDKTLAEMMAEADKAMVGNS